MTGLPESQPHHSSGLSRSISAACIHSFPPHPQIHGSPSLYLGSHGRNVGLQYNISIYLTCLSCNLGNFYFDCCYLSQLIILLYVIRQGKSTTDYPNYRIRHWQLPPYAMASKNSGRGLTLAGIFLLQTYAHKKQHNQTHAFCSDDNISLQYGFRMISAFSKKFFPPISQKLFYQFFPTNHSIVESIMHYTKTGVPNNL